jgi:hypothetical protein
MLSYRATLQRKGNRASWRTTQAICYGSSEFMAALHAEQMAPEHRCISLKHRMVGVIAKEESAANHFIQSIIECCSQRTEIGLCSIGPVNFRVLTDEHTLADTWFDEIHLINPTPSWQERWRGLIKRGQTVNAHYFDLNAHQHTPAYRNYYWDDLEALIAFWSDWYEREAAEELFALHSGEFSNAGPIASVGLASHLQAPSVALLMQQLVECGACRSDSHLVAVWATLNVPATAKLADVVKIQCKLTQLLTIEPEMNLGIRSAHSAFQIALLAWRSSEKL